MRHVFKMFLEWQSILGGKYTYNKYKYVTELLVKIKREFLYQGKNVT